MELIQISYAIAIVLAAIHQFTLRKREFLAAVLVFVIGSWIAYGSNPEAHKLAFACGISFSFLGDLAMAKIVKMTGKRIIDGIIFFSIAHILYLWGITGVGVIKWDIAIPIAIMVGGVGYWKVAYEPKKPVLSAGALFYSIIIGTLFASILAEAIFSPSAQTFMRLVGIILFMGSDMMIAFREFRKDFNQSERWISGTYVLGQLCLLGSIFVIGA